MAFLNELKAFNVDNGSIEEMVALLSMGKALLAEFSDLEDSGVETPAWLPAKLKAIRREIVSRNQDAIERRLAEARTKLEGLKTPQQRKADLDREISRLQKLRTSAE